MDDSKRKRDDPEEITQEPPKRPKTEPTDSTTAPIKIKNEKRPVTIDDVADSDDEGDEVAYVQVTAYQPVDGDAAKRMVCPYLDTINRNILDFDFEKLCSVTMANLNVYACLVCGKYFQGRGSRTQAHFHSLQADHHIYVNLHTNRFYCLPDNYQVVDSSLADIQRVLNPLFSSEMIEKLDQNTKYTRCLDGSRYLPGVMGLNNIKNNDAMSVVFQALIQVRPLRDFLLKTENTAKFAEKSPLVRHFGELARRMWSGGRFRPHVSPHEILQAVETNQFVQRIPHLLHC